MIQFNLEGVLCEKTDNKNTDTPIIILTGLGVMPTSGYLGSFPERLTDLTSQTSFTVYQPAVSGNGHRRGYYSPETTRLQFEVAQKIADGRRWYPITHSLSTITGLQIALGEYEDSDLSNVLDGTISAVMTNTRDGLTKPNGEERNLFGIPWLKLFELCARYLPKDFQIALPIYPLASANIHGCSTDQSPIGTSRWVNPISARYTLSHDSHEVVKGKTLQKSPLFLIPTEDQIFDPKLQEQIVDKLKAEKCYIQAGHRWFTANEENAIKQISDHYYRSRN